jgi:DNA-binding Lrp family transcriptional regulator
MMDDLDRAILAKLRKDARTSVSSIANELKVARATVQHRITRLENTGTITGYTVKVSPESSPNLIRAVMSIATEGNTAKAVVRRLSGSPHVAAIHSTNGKWDLIAEIQAESLAEFDAAINEIREMKEITGSETNLLLSTYNL